MSEESGERSHGGEDKMREEKAKMERVVQSHLHNIEHLSKHLKAVPDGMRICIGSAYTMK